MGPGWDWDQTSLDRDRTGTKKSWSRRSLPVRDTIMLFICIKLTKFISSKRLKRVNHCELIRYVFFTMFVFTDDVSMGEQFVREENIIRKHLLTVLLI